MNLNTTNPHCFSYATEELLIELLGGIKIDTLDRMRATIKVTVVNRKHASYLNNAELAGLSVRHNLDLYNDVQVEKFIRRVAEKLEIGSIALTKAIAAITSQLEEYRLKQLDKQEARKEKVLTSQEREDATRFLEQKDLLQRTNDLIGKSGVIGEEKNRLLMYLIFTSRKREHPLHVISLGSSGAGKSHLQKKWENYSFTIRIWKNLWSLALSLWDHRRLAKDCRHRYRERIRFLICTFGEL